MNYDQVGATRPEAELWSPEVHPGYRGFEHTALLGEGEEFWNFASEVLLRWGIKTRSGFSVQPEGRGAVAPGEHYSLIAHLGPFRVREPVRVVAVVDRPDRRGFAYGTLQGHPVSGEEAFVLHRDAEANVWLTLRSLTRAPQGRWRLVFPLSLVAQRWYRRRYLRALQPETACGRTALSQLCGWGGRNWLTSM